MQEIRSIVHWAKATHSGAEILTQTSLNYANIFGKHNVDAMFLMESRDYGTNRFAAYGKGFYFTELPELSMARVPSQTTRYPVQAMQTEVLVL
jgi:hypothetical protein